MIRQGGDPTLDRIARAEVPPHTEEGETRPDEGGRERRDDPAEPQHSIQAADPFGVGLEFAGRGGRIGHRRGLAAVRDDGGVDLEL